MRKRGSLTKGLCLAVITFAMNATIITATENDNTTVDNATVIDVNSAYSDNLLDSSDVNWYEFSLSDDGVISLEFAHDYLESNGRYWRVTLYDSGQKELASYAFSGNTTSYKQGQIGVPAGSYYVKLTDDDYYSDVNYNVKINFTESKEWETEFNEEYTAADEITVNSTYYGSMRTSSDADWYIFTLNEDGYISLDFVHDYLESNGRYWRATLYDSGQKELASYAFSGNTTNYKQGQIGVPEGSYYVKLTDDDYYSDVNYNVKINFTESKEWETEFNEEYTAADEITVNSAYYGSMRTSSDTDWYTFKLNEDGYISLDFAHDYLESNGRYWRATLYDSGQKELASYAFSGNTTSYKQGQIGVPAGSYYVKLTDDDYYSDVNYNVTINYNESSEWETEFNEEYSAADEIAVNSPYYGSLRTSSDTDWYTFTLNEDGYISLSFAHDYLESSGRYWCATLYDSGQKELVSYTFSGDTTSYEQESLNVETGKYYVKFTDDSYYSDLNYKFKINYDTKSNEPLENPFVDVNEDKYYYDAVIWAVNNGITNGKDATHFKPDEKCTRAQVVTFLWRTMGEPEPMLIENPFEDVAEEDYYYKAVLWAYENNITQGIDDTHFAPGKTVTRAQFVTFLYRNEDEPEYTVSNPFVDVKQNKYYYDAVLWAYENDIVLGKDETHFGPEDYATRGQVVTFLYRAYGE